MDLRHMEHALAVAEAGQFTAAASRVGVSQSGLSASIKALEAELGTPLFERTTRNVTPTEAGLAFLRHARAAVDQVVAAKSSALSASQKLSGTLRVGSEQCLGVIDVPALLAAFHKSHPQVRIDFTQTGTADFASWIHDGALDFAFVAAEDLYPIGTARRFATERMVVLSSPTHAFSEVRDVDWADLSMEPMVDFQDGWAVRRVNDRLCRTYGVQRDLRGSVNDTHALLDLVRREFGVAIVPAPVAQKPQAVGLSVSELPSGAASAWTMATMQAPTQTASHLVPHLTKALRYV